MAFLGGVGGMLICVSMLFASLRSLGFLKVASITHKLTLIADGGWLDNICGINIFFQGNL